MKGLQPALAAAALVALTLPLAGQPADRDRPLDAKTFAQRVFVSAAPVHPFRYNQPIPAYSQTRSLLERRRAFSPGERVTLTFALPAQARLAAPLKARLAVALHALDGGKVADLGQATLTAKPGDEPPTLPGPGPARPLPVEGRLEWTVPEAAEGQYLLAAKLTGEDGAALVSRSNIVFLTPAYPKLLQAAREALAAARERAKADPLLREVSLPSTEMLVEDAEMRWSDFGIAPRDWEYVKQNLETARAFAERLAAGEDPWKARKGAFTKAYRSGIDATLQPYGIWVPPSYDPAKPTPMVVSLHGATSNHLLNRRRVFGLGNRPGESDYDAIRTAMDFPDTGFIVVTPYGRGEVAGYNGIAEQDVLRAMDDVVRAYNVDRDRVHLTGLSMGGGGTWHIGLRNPDRFASITPVCAVADMDFMPWTAGWDPLDRELMALTGYSKLVENASNQKVFVFHGDDDSAVDVSASRRMMNAFEKAGLSVARYFELPGVTHFAWDFAYRNAELFPRVAEVRRDPFPERVVYATFSPRYNKSFWLRIDRIERGMTLARIEGTRKPGAFDVKTTNLGAFSLLLAPEIAPAGKPLTVTVDGKQAFRGTVKGDALSLARVKGAWKVTRPWSGPAQGPPDHAEAGFRSANLAQYGPHVYVYGTLGDTETNAASRAGAELLADWSANVRANWRVLADTEVTPEVMAANNLVLVGTAATNGVVAQLQDELPLRQDTAGTWAGTRKLAGPGGTYRLAHPNPLAPGRLLLIYGGGSTKALQRFLASGRQAPGASLFADYLVIGEDDKVALQGYFRDDYRIVDAGPPAKKVLLALDDEGRPVVGRGDRGLAGRVRPHGQEPYPQPVGRQRLLGLEPVERPAVAAAGGHLEHDAPGLNAERVRGTAGVLDHALEGHPQAAFSDHRRVAGRQRELLADGDAARARGTRVTREAPQAHQHRHQQGVQRSQDGDLRSPLPDHPKP